MKTAMEHIQHEDQQHGRTNEQHGRTKNSERSLTKIKTNSPTRNVMGTPLRIEGDGTGAAGNILLVVQPDDSLPSAPGTSSSFIPGVSSPDAPIVAVRPRLADPHREQPFS